MASCEKENLNINYTDKSSSFQSLKNTGTTTQASFREYYDLVGGCIPVVENCHPNDIVITGGGSSLSGLDAAIAISSLEVANNFSNKNTAISLIPNGMKVIFKSTKLLYYLVTILLLNRLTII